MAGAAATTSGGGATGSGLANTYFADMIPRAPNGDAATDAQRAEINRILQADLAAGKISGEDRLYLSQMIANRTGLSPAEAEQRVDLIYAQAKQAADETKAKAMAAADDARTDLSNPCEGIRGLKLNKSSVYITDDIYNLVYQHGKDTLRDAMDLAYLTGQRPADTLKMTARDIVDGHLLITQNKVNKPLRVAIIGKLAELLERIAAKKKARRIVTASLLVNEHGKSMTGPALRYQFDRARAQAWAAHPDRKAELKKFSFKDLRAKAADDTSEVRGDQAASDLLGHETLQTTRRHYLRRGKAVPPTK
nr:tyrosine-type recombinase/integrase [Duganella lactea]